MYRAKNAKRNWFQWSTHSYVTIVQKHLTTRNPGSKISGLLRVGCLRPKNSLLGTGRARVTRYDMIFYQIRIIGLFLD
jgi:hypothetical protein